MYGSIISEIGSFVYFDGANFFAPVHAVMRGSMLVSSLNISSLSIHEKIKINRSYIA